MTGRRWAGVTLLAAVIMLPAGGTAVQAAGEAPSFKHRPMSEKIFADADLKREFKAWLLDPKNLAAFDRGTMLIPEKFLASGAVAATPVGFAPSNLQPAFGFVQAGCPPPRPSPLPLLPRSRRRAEVQRSAAPQTRRRSRHGRHP